MPIGALTDNIDVTEVVLSAFFLFFLGLVYHLRQEDKREGYPLVDEVNDRRLDGFPVPPPNKTFQLLDGGKATTPRAEPPQPIAARPLHLAPGSPIVPIGDPLRDGVGPAAFAQRRDQPLIYGEDKIQVLPMRELEDWSVFEGATDPRGMVVVASDGAVVGIVRDLWIDRSVKITRYLEVELDAPPRPVLVPIYYANIKASRRRIFVKALTSKQFAEAPDLREPNRITAREEDRVNAYHAGAAFYNRRYVSGFAI